VKIITDVHSIVTPQLESLELLFSGVLQRKHALIQRVSTYDFETVNRDVLNDL